MLNKIKCQFHPILFNFVILIFQFFEIFWQNFKLFQTLVILVSKYKSKNVNFTVTLLLQDTRGRYYKTFYGSNCCRIVISQSVCHFLSLQPQSNIWGQGLIILEYSHILDSALIVGSQSCTQILVVEVTGSGKHSSLLRYDNNYNYDFS